MFQAPRLVHQLADATASLDRNQIETSLGLLLLDFLQADSVTFMRLEDGKEALMAVPWVAASRNAAGEATCARAEPVPVRIDRLPGAMNCVKAGEPQIRFAKGGYYESQFPIDGPAGQIAGLLLVHSKRRPDLRDRDLVKGILRIAHNHLELVDYGTRDALTGLLNRRTFEAEFERVRASIGSGPLAERGEWVALVDVDQFKSINDRFGRAVGDDVLLQAGRIMQENFRNDDLVYRFGGEDFLVLLRRVTANDAATVIERLRAAMEKHAFAQVGTVTASIGWTRMMPGDTPSAAIDRADAALHFAKDNGRNQAHEYERLVADELLEAGPDRATERT